MTHKSRLSARPTRLECARRLYAVALCCQMGIKSVDYVLKKYVPKTIDDPYWTEKVAELQFHLVDSFAQGLEPKGPTDTIQ